MKKKLLFLLFFIFLITGCTANYNVEIYNNEIRVNGKLLEGDSSKWDYEIFGTPYHEVIDWKTTGDENSTIADGLFKISDKEGLGIGLKNTYKLSEDYENSPGIKACYKYFDVSENKKEIIFSTSVENTCFDVYPNLENITVKLKTNHKVVSSNASNVKGYNYTWYLTKENKDDSAILLTIKKNEYIFNYENEFINKVIYIGVIIGIILGIGGIVYIYFTNKTKKMNQI